MLEKALQTEKANLHPEYESNRTNLHPLHSWKKFSLTYLLPGDWLELWEIVLYQGFGVGRLGTQQAWKLDKLGESMHSLIPSTRATSYMGPSSKHCRGQAKRLPDTKSRSFCLDHQEPPTKWSLWSVPSYFTSMSRVHSHILSIPIAFPCHQFSNFVLFKSLTSQPTLLSPAHVSV